MVQKANQKEIPVVHVHLFPIQVNNGRYTPNHDLRVTKCGESFTPSSIYEEYSDKFHVCVHQYPLPTDRSKVEEVFTNISEYSWNSDKIEEKALLDLTCKIKAIILDERACGGVSISSALKKKWNDIYNTPTIYPDETKCKESFDSGYHVVGLLTNYKSQNDKALYGSMFDKSNRNGFIIFNETANGNDPSETQTTTHPSLYLRLIVHEFTHALTGSISEIHRDKNNLGTNSHGTNNLASIMNITDPVENCVYFLDPNKSEDGYEVCWNYTFSDPAKCMLKNISEWPGQNHGKIYKKYRNGYAQKSISQSIKTIKIASKKKQELYVGEPALVQIKISTIQPLGSYEVEKFLNASEIEVKASDILNDKEIRTFRVPNYYRFVDTEDDGKEKDTFKATIPVFTDGKDWKLPQSEKVKIEISIQDKYADISFKELENVIHLKSIDEVSEQLINNKLLLKLYLEQNPELTEEDGKNLEAIKTLLENYQPALASFPALNRKVAPQTTREQLLKFERKWLQKNNLTLPHQLYWSINTYYQKYNLRPKLSELINVENKLTDQRRDKAFNLYKTQLVKPNIKYDSPPMSDLLHPRTLINLNTINRKLDKLKKEYSSPNGQDN